MSTLRQAAQQALEALERVMSHGQAVEQAKEALRAALAEPEEKYTFGTPLLDAVKNLTLGDLVRAALEKAEAST